MANSNTKTFVNNINLPISVKRISTASKASKKKIMDNIMVSISALFNSGGGQLTLDFEEKPCSYKEVDNCLKTIEQRVRNLTSTATVSNIIITKSKNEIIMSIPSSSRLVVLTYNLYLPEECEVLLLPPAEPVENVKKILQGNAAKSNPTTINSHCKEFFKGQDVGFGESKVAQLKFVKTEATKNVTVAMRICGKTNKFRSYVSAFSNHSGGHIYVGVREDGIVIGENLCEKDKDEIIREVYKAVQKMVRPNHIGKPTKGKHWEVFFEPVKNDKGHVIPSLFVVVIFIGQCPGGVFVEEPESHHIVNKMVKRMNFSEWLSHFQDHPNSAPLQVPSPVSQPISSEITDHESHSAFPETPERSGVLRSGRVLFPSLPEQSSHFQDRSSFAPLQVPPALPISIALRDRDSDDAFAETPESSQVRNGQVPLPSAPEQSSHFQTSTSSASFTQVPLPQPNSREITASSDITEKCKQCRNNENWCEKVLSDLEEKEMRKNPRRGNARTRLLVLSEKVIVAYKKHNFKRAEELLCDFENQLKSSEELAEQFRPKARYLKSCVESAKGNYEKSFEIATEGLEKMESIMHPELISSKDQIDFYLHTAMLATILHCKHGVVESVEIYKAREYLQKATRRADVSKVSPDLLQKLHIYKACVLLRCSLTGEASHSSRISKKDIETAISELLAVERIILEGHPLSNYRKTQFLLVTSDLFYRHQFNYKMQLKFAYEKAEEGKALAKKCHFKEMALYASKRMAVITEKIIRVQLSQNGNEVDEKFSPNTAPCNEEDLTIQIRHDGKLLATI